MFGIGFYELVVIVLVAVIVVGPKRLPFALKAVGRAIGEFRRAMSDLKQEVAFDDVVSEVSRPLREGIAEAQRGAAEIERDILADSSGTDDMEYPEGGPDDYGALPEFVSAYALSPPKVAGDEEPEPAVVSRAG